MKKRKKWNENIDSIALIKETEGYNGADLEAVVKDTIERAFIEGRTTITTADLIRSIKDTKSISCTLKDKIASIQKTVEKIDIKPASLEDKKEKEPDPSQAYVKAAKAKAEPNPLRAKVIAEPGVKTAASVTSAKRGLYADMFGVLMKEQKGKQQ